jgi:hypothetical protein
MTSNVMPPTDLPPTSSELTGMGRSILLGSVIGAVAAFGGVFGAIALWCHDTSTAFGVGGMAAFWGGLGFGSMLGGTMHLMRHSDEPYSHGRAAPAEPTSERS